MKRIVRHTGPQSPWDDRERRRSRRSWDAVRGENLQKHR